MILTSDELLSFTSILQKPKKTWFLRVIKSLIFSFCVNRCNWLDIKNCYLYVTYKGKTVYPYRILWHKKTLQILSLQGLCFLNNYLFENCGALLAFLRPYFFLSTILSSLVRNPAFLSAGLNCSSALTSALAIPCLIAPDCPLSPPP